MDEDEIPRAGLFDGITVRCLRAVYARLGTEDGRWFVRWRIGRLMISASELGAMNFDA
jgi:hypothetical protein